MTDKALFRTRIAKKTAAVGKYVVTGAAALLMELGGSALSAAPCSAALTAALGGLDMIAAIIGGAVGALFHGIPAAFSGLGAVFIVLAARVIPDLGSRRLRIAERSLAVTAGVFFARVSEASAAAEILSVIVASFSSGAFTLCLCLLLDGGRSGADALLRLADTDKPSVNALRCAVIIGAFMPLGALDYDFANLGRLIMGAAALVLSAGRGVLTGAAFSAAALCGLCISAKGGEIAVGAAVTAAAAAASSVFARHGRIVRAAGYVFMCAGGTLVSGSDEGSWRLLAEAAVSAALFAASPYEKLSAPDSCFADKSVAAMIHERLNFAAEAIAGVGSGITAAAEVLDKKYSIAFDELPDRAADRACRSCPMSMTCWGKHYSMFRGEFERLTGQLRAGYDLTEFSVAPECAEICVNRMRVVKAITAEYSRYVSAKADERRVRELRRIYTDELCGVRDILRDMGAFSREVSENDPARDSEAERRVERLLRSRGAEDARAFVTRDSRGKLRVEAYSSSEPKMTREYLGTLLEKAVGRELELPEISGGGRCRITASERSRLSAKIGAFQLAARDNKVSGDSYECFTGADGALYIILSDGMGTGSRAKVDSAMACSVASKLLKSGITLSAALETVNTVLMVKSADESYATLDICKIDLNSGDGAVYKAGAAVTYIKSDDKLIRAALSSPPAGTGGKLTVPAQRFKVGKGDVIVMMTDGVSPDEQWLSRELSRTVDPAELSERIARTADNGRKDDVSVVAVSISS